jgi:hypothetical protein
MPTPLEERLTAIERAIGQLADRQQGIFSDQQFQARAPALAPFSRRFREELAAARPPITTTTTVDLKARYRPVFSHDAA